MEDILHYEKELPGEMREGWERLRDSLVGEGFSSLMERYVGMDLLEDRLDREGEARAKIEALADQAVQEPQLLEAELSWLVTDAAKNGYRFGYAVAGKDAGLSLLPTLLEAQRNAAANGTAVRSTSTMRRAACGRARRRTFARMAARRAGVVEQPVDLVGEHRQVVAAGRGAFLEEVVRVPLLLAGDRVHDDQDRAAGQRLVSGYHTWYPS